jgi:hypothetical protein
MNCRISTLPRFTCILIAFAACFILSAGLIHTSDRLFRAYISSDSIRPMIDRVGIQQGAKPHSRHLPPNPSQMAERAFGVRLDSSAGRKTTLSPYPDKQLKEKKP